jgi:hypothetical protein
MSSHYNKLFQVRVEHKYFSNLRFTGFNFFPTAETRSLFLKYGLLLKLQPDGFMVSYAGEFEGAMRNRAAVLMKGLRLQISCQLTDTSFYQYTGNLPDVSVKKTFRFSNFDEKKQAVRKSDLLHLSEFVAESEIRQPAGSNKDDGYIEIYLDDHLEEDLYIRFLNRSTYWRYIIVSEHLQQSGNLAIVDMENKKLFSGPESVTLPDGLKGITFIADEPIAISQKTSRHFQLVADYDETTKHFERVLIPQLPAPSLSAGPKDSEIIIYL